MSDKLAECPEVKSYRASQLAQLESDLEAIDDATVVEPVASLSDILLTPKGITKSSEKLTTVALSQLCRALCPGLVKVIADLAGIGVTLSPRLVRQDVAVETYNKVLTARFDQLTDKSLVRHLKAKRIDGIIGAGYRTLSNKSFFDMVQDAVAVTSSVFHSATLHGRTLLLCYRHSQPFTELPEPYYGGYYFTNSEVGDCSVKIAALLLRAKTGDYAINPFKRGRMVHIGRSFIARVRKAVVEAVGRDFNGIWMKNQLNKLPKVSLGFAGLDDKGATERVDELVSKLARCGLGTQLAERVVYAALYRGRDNVAPKAYEATIKRQLWANRTSYDLFVSLIRDANNRPLSVRESMQKAAYALVTNKISLGK